MRKHTRHGSAPFEVVSADEYTRMQEAVSGNGRHDVRAALILALMYYAGLRRAEVCNLTMHQVKLGVDQPRLEIRQSKFGKGRNVPLDPRLVPLIERWLTVRAVDSCYLVCTYQRVKPNIVAVCPSPPGSQIKVNTVWNTVRTTTRRSGVRREIRPHMLRHAAATNWMQAGLSLREVQYLLGHENIATTQRYLHVHDHEIAAKVYAYGNPPNVTIPIRQSQPRRVDAFKECEWCAEPIRYAARLCRFCNREATT